MAIPSSKISRTPENDSFAVSLIHLELRKESVEDYMKVGESKVAIGLQNSEQDDRTADRIPCSLEGWQGFSHGSGEENSSRPFNSAVT